MYANVVWMIVLSESHNEPEENRRLQSRNEVANAVVHFYNPKRAHMMQQEMKEKRFTMAWNIMMHQNVSPMSNRNS